MNSLCDLTILSEVQKTIEIGCGSIEFFYKRGFFGGWTSKM